MTAYTPNIGDIGLTTISGHVGRLIRFGQWLNGDGFTKAEHAFVITESARDGKPFRIVEAMPGKDGARDVPNWHADADTVYLRCPDEFRFAVAAAARELVGTPYAWSDYAALALHRFHIPTPHLKHYIETSNHMICSQLADRAAERGGWRIFSDNRWNGDVTPGDLRRAYRDQRALRVMAGDPSR